jgi:hypothetical protein
MDLNPRAPQGPSDDELNRITPDPYIPPYGGSGALFADLVAGPLMDPGRASSVLMVGDTVKTSIGLQTVRKY